MYKLVFFNNIELSLMFDFAIIVLLDRFKAASAW